MKEKIQYFPITSYAIIMGLSGLAIVFGKFYHMQWMPRVFYDTLLFFTFALFLTISFFYGLKAIRHLEEVKTDFNHRIRINFFSAISISLLLLSIAFMTYWPFLSMSLWWTGTILQTILMFYTISFWIRHNFEIHFMNPAWFIPISWFFLLDHPFCDFSQSCNISSSVTQKVHSYIIYFNCTSSNRFYCLSENHTELG